MTRLLASTALPLFVLAASVQPQPVAAQTVQDFQLPPNPTPSPSPSSTVQGPVDSESGPIAPRGTATPTPTPAPSATQRAAPSPAPTPVLRLPSPSPSPVPSPVRSPRPRTVQSPAPTTLPAPTPIESPTPQASTPVPALDTAPDAGLGASPSVSAPPPQATASADPAGEPDEGGGNWWWIAALVLVAGAGAAFAWKRSRADAPVPVIEPPRVRRDAPVIEDVAEDKTPAAEPPAPAPVPAPVAPMPVPARPAEPPAPELPIAGTPLSIRFEPLRLSRSVMAATLYYRATVLNRGEDSLNEVVLEADLGSASGARPVDQQVLDEAAILTPRHVFGRMSRGQSARFEGSVQVPLAQADTIRQGNVALLVPLMRIRVTARDAPPFARTFAIGQTGASGSNRLQPFRLDEGLRSWEPLAQRVLERPSAVAAG